MWSLRRRKATNRNNGFLSQHLLRQGSSWAYSAPQSRQVIEEVVQMNALWDLHVKWQLNLAETGQESIRQLPFYMDEIRTICS